MKIDLSRFKNYSLWVSMFALLGLILTGFGVAIVPVAYSNLTNAILSVLVGMGIVSNPLTSGYADKKDK